jgi:GT2 family glycosyltransferase
MSPEISMSVIVPSYGRPAELAACLGDLGCQDWPGSYEVLIVARPDDGGTHATVAQFRPAVANCSVRSVTVNRAGIVMALGVGFKMSRGTFVAFCDDDARYHPDWLTRLRALFVDDNVGGAGGRIAEPGPAARPVEPRDVARVSWSGRARYNVRGEPTFDSPCMVHMLPGANMCFRRGALDQADFDVRLDAPGLSPGMELAIGWQVRMRGFRILFDPTLVVDHFPAPWADGERGRNEARTFAYSRNTCYIMLTNLGPLPRVAFLLRFYLIGERESPGIASWLILASLGRAPHGGWLRHSMAGKRAGRRLAHAAHRVHRVARNPARSPASSRLSQGAARARPRVAGPEG